LETYLKQLITQYVEAKTAQYVNTLAKKAVLNQIVEANTLQSLQKANMNGAAIANKYEQLLADFLAGGGANSRLATIDEKNERQMLKRGWSGMLIDDVIANPYTKRKAENKATEQTSTVYYQKNGSYVVVEDNTNLIIQISDRTDPNWAPDPTIINPYIPKK
jgi:hypothetical protein